MADAPRRPAAASNRGLYGSTQGENMLRAAVAEGLGTFILVLAGTAAATAAALDRPIARETYDSLAVALAFGLVLVSLVAALGHVSGAHVNPAVTLGLAATGKFPWQYVPAYVGAQLLGATFAALAVWACFGDAARETAHLAATYPAPTASAGQALLAEILITFVLVFVICSVATDDRVPAAAAGPAVGFALAAAVLIGGPVSGGAANPARALGPMLVAGKFTAAWVYLIGPVAGGVAAALLYDKFVKKAEKPTE
jgi:MIP family channel proteins